MFWYRFTIEEKGTAKVVASQYKCYDYMIAEEDLHDEWMQWSRKISPHAIVAEGKVYTLEVEDIPEKTKKRFISNAEFQIAKQQRILDSLGGSAETR